MSSCNSFRASESPHKYKTCIVLALTVSKHGLNHPVVSVGGKSISKENERSVDILIEPDNLTFQLSLTL